MLTTRLGERGLWPAVDDAPSELSALAVESTSRVKRSTLLKENDPLDEFLTCPTELEGIRDISDMVLVVNEDFCGCTMRM